MTDQEQEKASRPPERHEVGGAEQDAAAYIPSMSEQETQGGWSKWYRDARAEMEFRYGARGIPTDTYKEQWAAGRTVQEACRWIAKSARSGRGKYIP